MVVKRLRVGGIGWQQLFSWMRYDPTAGRLTRACPPECPTGDQHWKPRADQRFATPRRHTAVTNPNQPPFNLSWAGWIRARARAKRPRVARRYSSHQLHVELVREPEFDVDNACSCPISARCSSSSVPTLRKPGLPEKRTHEQTITAPPPVVMWALRLAANTGVASLLDHSEQRWRQLTSAKSGGWYQGFLLHARDAMQTLRDGTGWEIEYPRDVWRLHTLPGLTVNTGKAPDARNHLRLDRITQPWLRVLAKRWARLRLTSGLAIGTVLNDVAALTGFSAFLHQAVPSVDALAAVDRALLERYQAWLAT
jgi:hypothetical protein